MRNGAEPVDLGLGVCSFAVINDGELVITLVTVDASSGGLYPNPGRLSSSFRTLATERGARLAEFPVVSKVVDLQARLMCWFVLYIVTNDLKERNAQGTVTRNGRPAYPKNRTLYGKEYNI